MLCARIMATGYRLHVLTPYFPSFFALFCPQLRWCLILSADFERCVFSYFSFLIVYIFFSPPKLRPGLFELRLIIFQVSRFFVHIFFLHVFTILHFFGMPKGESDTAPTNKICRRVSSEQCPRTRSCHESEHLV